jgi:hypothetical protein
MRQRHIELHNLEKDLDGNYRDPALPIVYLSVTYEGFGVGFSNIAAAAAYGLRIPLIPVYVVGIFVGVSYLLLEIRATYQDRQLQRRRILELEQSMITDNYYAYLSFTLPGFVKNQKFIDINTVLKTHSAEQITHCLGHYYRIVDELSSRCNSQRMKLLRKRLDLKFAAEGSQFKNPALTETLNKVCAKPLAHSESVAKPSKAKLFWDNLRKYYKSALSGAATAGGVTIFILTTALTTATTTALFPWSLVGILIITLVGGYVGYKIDKHLDRKRKHKDNLQNTQHSHLSLRNEKRVADLFRSTIATLNEISHFFNSSNDAHTLSATTQKPDVLTSHSEVTQNPDSASAPVLSDQDYCEVAELRQQSQAKRRVADFILPTLTLARGGFAAVSSLFAGIGFAGLVLPLLPVFIGGGVMLGIHIIFKIWNNWVKHQREIQLLNNLNMVISPHKILYWKEQLPQIHDVEGEIKSKSTTEILKDLEREYQQFKAALRTFASLQHRSGCQETTEALKNLHLELLYLYRAHADSLNNKTLSSALAETTEYVQTTTYPPIKIITVWTKISDLFTPVVNLIVNNFKDIIQGIAFGFGLSLTVFVILGITTIMATTAILIVSGAALAGVAIKMAIRYGIKASRNDHLATIDGAGKSIADKEALFDCRVETQSALKRAEALIGEAKAKRPEDSVNPANKSSTFEKSPTVFSKDTVPKRSARPVLWIESSASKEAPQEEVVKGKSAPSPTIFAL